MSQLSFPDLTRLCCNIYEKIGGISMNDNRRVNSNYNDQQYNRENDSRNEQNDNAYGQPSYMPNQNNYDERGYTDYFYDDYEDSGAGSFLLGAIVGGVIGAAAALFLAPKTGKEMRDDLSTQAVHLKDKGIEISSAAKGKATEFTTVAKDKATEFTSVAKDKATEYSSAAKDKATEYTTAAKDKANEFTSLAKDKTDEVTKSFQDQSDQLVKKVKSMTSKTSVPMDDGTASSEGEEAIEFVEKIEQQVNDKLDDSKEVTTATAEAIKEAVVKVEAK